MAASYRLSYAGYHKLLQTEANIPYVYDDNRKKGDPPLARYEDARGSPTIGMGLKIDTAEEKEAFRPYLNGKHAPKELIDEWNARTVAQFEYDLNRKLDGVLLNPNQFDALFSLAWNRGVYSDDVRRVIDYARAGDYDSAAYCILNSAKTIDGKPNEGLARRRQEEAALFSAPYVDGEESSPETPNVPAQGSSTKGTATVPFYKDSFIVTHMVMGVFFLGALVLSLRKNFGRDKISEKYFKEQDEYYAREARAKEKPSFPSDLEPSTVSNPRRKVIPRRRPMKRLK